MTESSKLRVVLTNIPDKVIRFGPIMHQKQGQNNAIDLQLPKE